MAQRKAKLKRFKKIFVLKSSFLKKFRRLSLKDIVFLVVVSLYIATAAFKLSDPVLWEKKISQKPDTLQIIPVKYPPTAVKIPVLNKELIVSAALVKGNTWDVFDDKIAWLATSAVPGEGNVILYGHARQALFGDLYKLKPGDLVQVKKGDLWYSYKVTEVHRVTPDDVNSILSEKNRLTLYTCDGSFDEKRLVVYADPVD